MKSLEMEVILRPSGGNYYRAMGFHWLFVSMAIVPTLILVLLALINPFWFRSAMFDWVEQIINRVSRWRNYTKYRIYLGTDPALWHTLRGDIKE